jgi:steroid delta-isomerase-like uncharacterized protein
MFVRSYVSRSVTSGSSGSRVGSRGHWLLGEWLARGARLWFVSVENGERRIRLGFVMTVEENKEVVRCWVDAWNAKDVDGAEGLLRPDYVRHDPSVPDIVGPQAERQFIAGALTAFPDLHFEVEQLVAEDDLVFCRLTVRGTHRAEFMGVPPSGRHVRFESVDIYRLLDTKIAEQWVVMDTFGLLQQIGAIPSPGEAQA